MRHVIAVIAVLALAGCATQQPVTEYRLPTTAELSTYDDNTLSANVSIHHGADYCVVATVDGKDYFTIWPEGFHQDELGNVIALDGTPYGQGGAFIGTVILTDRRTVAAASDSRLDPLITYCQGDAEPVAIILSLDD